MTGATPWVSDDPDEELDPMVTWTTPQFSKTKVNQAGVTLANPMAHPDEHELALFIVNNWRSSHSFPLNTFQMTLRKKARQVDRRPLVAQRIKRLTSITSKLERFPSMRLSRMQDIGGCRAVVTSRPRVDELADLYQDSVRLKHELVGEPDDYIRNPKTSGYRGIHLVYRYHSDRNATYEGLQIEMQLRSRLQHAWATAVETVGTFTKQALKSSQGEDRWLRFFAVMGSEMALRERTPTVPGTPSKRAEIRSELRQLADVLDLVPRLRMYGETLKIVEEQVLRELSDSSYFLLELDALNTSLKITGFQRNELEAGAQSYLAAERRFANRAGCDAVLVAVETFSALRRAYPNYFLDTSAFVDAVEQAIS